MFSLHPFPYNANDPHYTRTHNQQSSQHHHGHPQQHVSEKINMEEKLNHVRHAGRVQVRGMIRRVWRPRYLELDEDGVLRYYEASVSTTSTTSTNAEGGGSSSNSRSSNSNSNSGAMSQLAARIDRKMIVDDGHLKRKKKRHQHHRQPYSSKDITAYTPSRGDNKNQGHAKRLNNNQEDTLIPEMQAFSLPPAATKKSESSIKMMNQSKEKDSLESALAQDINPTSTSNSSSSHISDGQQSARMDLTFGSDDEVGVVVHESYITPPNNNNNDKKRLISKDHSTLTTNNNPVSTRQTNEKKNLTTSEVERIGSWDHISEATLTSSRKQQQQQKLQSKTKQKEPSEQIINPNEKQSPAPIATVATTTANVTCNQQDTSEKIVTFDISTSHALPPTSTQTPANTNTNTNTVTSNNNNDVQPRDIKKKIITQNLHHHLHNHRPKTTMTILSARIIDVNTLSDMHVGLPKHRFGFVFCGRPLLITSNDTSIHSPSDISDDICHPLSILATEHDYFATSRDYLCSVSTLEEAQSWVVALNWAAKVAIARSNSRRRRHIGSLFEDEDDIEENDEDVDDDDMTYDGNHSCDDDLFLSAFVPNRHLTGRKQNALVDNFVIRSKGAATLRTVGAVDPVPNSLQGHPSSSTLNTTTSNHGAAEGIIIVTKVPCFRFQWYIYGLEYKVQMLLLRTCHQRNRTLKRKESTTIGRTLQQQQQQQHDEQWSVEEHTIFRSLNDFIQLVQHLIKEHDETSTSSKEDNKEALINLLYQSKSKLSQTKTKQMSMNPNTTYSAYMESIYVVNTVLRNLSTNGNLCNSSFVRDFLSLLDEDISTQRQGSSSGSTIDVSKTSSPSLQHNRKHTKRKMLEIQIGESTDEFVQHWIFGGLKSGDSAGSSSSRGGTETCPKKFIILLQSPLVSMLLPIIAVWSMYISSRIWSKYLTLYITMRVDFILLSYIGVFCVGTMLAQKECHDVYALKCQSSSTLEKTNTAAAASLRAHHCSAVQDDNMTECSSLNAIEADSTDNEDAMVDASHTVVTATDGSTMDYDDGSTSDDSLLLSSPLPLYSEACPTSCWSRPDEKIFKVRGKTYLQDRIKVPSARSPFPCRGVDVWLSDNPERHIARHPSVLGGKLGDEDTFVVNFLLPFGNFVSYFSIPDVKDMPSNVADVWTKFINGDQQYRDARLKMLPVVIDGPWIVKKAIGPGTAPALLGAVIPIQYYFTKPTETKKGTYEIDIIISASRLANSILTVVKGHTKKLTIAFAFIIEAAEQSELPETVLCSFTLHSLHLEHCPHLPPYVESTDDEG